MYMEEVTGRVCVPYKGFMNVTNICQKGSGLIEHYQLFQDQSHCPWKSPAPLRQVKDGRKLNGCIQGLMGLALGLLGKIIQDKYDLLIQCVW